MTPDRLQFLHERLSKCRRKSGGIWVNAVAELLAFVDELEAGGVETGDMKERKYEWEEIRSALSRIEGLPSGLVHGLHKELQTFRRIRLTDTQEKRLVEDYKDGCSQRVLASRFGIGTAEVKRIVDEHAGRCT